MREIIFRGKRVKPVTLVSQWIYGNYVFKADNSLPGLSKHFIVVHDGFGVSQWIEVEPDTVGQYTGAYEFVNGNPNIKGRIFEGDIVQVWSRRRLAGESYYSQKSVYDEPCLVRAVVIFNKGEWQFDYNNKYNDGIAAARGNERYDRFVANSPVLFDWGHNRNRENLERYMKFNPNRTVHDIQVIGNIFDNPELLEEEQHHV